MKRNVISLLLALVMVFAITVALAPTAEATAPAAPTHHEHTDHEGWTAITAATTLTDGGKYYLAGWASGNGAKMTVSANANVVICLNGKTSQCQVPIQLAEGATVTVCDCVGGGKIRGTSQATVSSVKQQAILDMYVNCTVNWMGGTIENYDTATSWYSFALRVAAGTFNMYGGSVAYNMDQKRALVSVEGGTLNLCGGEITGGTNSSTSSNGANLNLSSGTVNMYTGSAITNGTQSGANGGNVAVNGGAFYMYDGTISGGQALASGKHGGNVYINKGTFTMNDGTISGGQAASKGGNIAALATGGNVTVNLLGGTISGGAAASGDNLYIQNYNNYVATVSAINATITGNAESTGHSVQLNAAADTITLGGNTQITGGASNLYLPGTAKVTLSDTTPLNGANIDINMEDPGTFAENVASDVSACFTSNNSGYIVAYENGTLKLVEAHTHCWCEGSTLAPSHTCNENLVWTDATELKSGTVITYTENNRAIYLTAGYHAGTIEFGDLTGEFYLDLNGKLLRGNTPLTVPTGVTLYITDCAGTGIIAGTNANNNTPAINVTGGTVYFLAGTLEGQYEMTDANGVRSNRNVSVSDGAFNMYGGTIQNGWIDKGTGNGGNVYVTGGEFNMFGGTVKDGVADATAAAASNMENKGGNIYALGGTLNISGGNISGGVSKANGGNIFVGEKAEANITGGTVSNGDGGSLGENIRSEGTLTLANCEITLTGTAGSNISLGNSTSETTLNGGAVITGGQYAINYGYGKLTLDGAVELAANEKELYLSAMNGVVVTLTANFSNAGDDKIRATKVFTAEQDSDENYKVQFAAGITNANEFVAARNGGSLLKVEDGNIYFVPSLASVEDDVLGYASLQEAVDAANGKLVTLRQNVTEDITVSGTLLLNLSGCTITGNVSATELLCYDSTTNLYDGSDAGYITGTVTGAKDVYVRDDGSNIRRYLKIEDENGTSFHRIYFAVTKVSLNPTGDVDMVLKTTFLGDEAVANYVNNTETAVTYGLWANGEKAGAEEAGKTFVKGPYDQSTLEHNVLTTGLIDAFKNGASDAIATANITAKAYITINGVDYFSAERAMCLNDVIAAANAKVDDAEKPLTATQLNALRAMVEKYYWTDAEKTDVQMTSWTEDIIGKIYPELFTTAA